jgi:ABC-type multidrug transport system fused ATPase/permease subunit
MENGTVAGKGTHEQLLSSCNTYKGLWETQKELEEFGKEGVLV